jgi:hypothetical protein
MSRSSHDYSGTETEKNRLKESGRLSFRLVCECYLAGFAINITLAVKSLGFLSLFLRTSVT